MTPEEKWKQFVAWCLKYHVRSEDSHGVLWADAELTRLREENAALTKERDAGLALTHCAVCGSDTANTNESAMNVELTRLRGIVARMEDVEGVVKAIVNCPEWVQSYNMTNIARAVRDYVMRRGDGNRPE